MEDKLDEVYERRLSEFKKKMERKRSAEAKTKIKVKTKRVTKKVIVLKSVIDIPITKNELIAMKKILSQYIKNTHENYRKSGKFFINTNDATEKYHYAIYSNVFKAYNKMSGRSENSPIFQTTLIKSSNEKN